MKDFAGLLAGVLLAAGSALATPAPAQESSPQVRGEKFMQLPYWPGYRVGENSAETPISGIALRAAAGPPPSDTLAVWANNAPWNEEGRRRMADVMRSQGGRKALGWGYPLPTGATTRRWTSFGRPSPETRSGIGKVTRW